MSTSTTASVVACGVHIGIDLGTMTFRLAESHAARHMPTILRNALANEATPSAVVLHAPESTMRACGDAAMGLSLLSSAVHDLKSWLLHAPETTRTFGGQPSHVTQSLAYLIRVLLSYRGEGNVEALGGVAIALPPYAPPQAAAVVEDAGRVLNLPCPVRAVDDVSCAAVYFHHARYHELPSDPAAAPVTVVIVNIGASSLSVGVVAATRAEVRVLAQHASPHGLDDVDTVLIESLLRSLGSDDARRAVRENLKAMHKLRREARKGREMLTSMESCGVVLEGLCGDLDLNANLTVGDVEVASAPLAEEINRAIAALGDAIKTALSAGPPRVECIGGGWRVPCVARALRQSLGVERLGVSLDAALSVAEGASLWSLLTPTLSGTPAATAAVEAAPDAHAVVFSLPPLPLSPDDARSDASTIASWAALEEAMAARDLVVQRRMAARDALESFVLRAREELRAIGEGAEGVRDAQSALSALEEYVWNDCGGDDAAAINACATRAAEALTTTCPAVLAHRQTLEEEARAKDEAMRQAAAAAEQDRELKSDPQRLRGARQRRDQGAALFKDGQYEDAQRRFVQGLAILGEMYDIQGENGQQKDEIALSCHLNIASCSVKLGLWRNAVNNCTKALDIVSDHPKALFRRGQARAALGELDEAESDLARAEALTGGDAAVVAALADVRAKQAATKAKEKAMFSRMFK